MKKLIIQEIDSLPALPKSILELEEFRKMPNQEPMDLLKIVEKDPLLITTILRVANSAMFGFVSKVDTPQRAISLLGINFTISIALGTAMQNLVNTDLSAYDSTIEDFIFSSNLASSFVLNWVSKIDINLKDQLILPAFLQEVGKFVISQVIIQSGKKDQFIDKLQINKNISSVEKQFLGFSCARITANIFKHWNLSHDLIFTIGFVEDLSNCPKEFLLKVKILEIIKILCDLRTPLSEQNIQRALNKADQYGLNSKLLIQSIESIKFKLDNHI